MEGIVTDTVVLESGKSPSCFTGTVGTLKLDRKSPGS